MKMKIIFLLFSVILVLGNSKMVSEEYNALLTPNDTLNEENNSYVLSENDVQNTCVHDHVNQMHLASLQNIPLDSKKHIKSLEKVNLDQEKNMESIRITVNTDQVKESYMEKVSEKIVPAIQEYFQSTLSVHRLKDNIKPSAAYLNYFTCGNQVQIPESLQKGVQNADLMVVITTQDKHATSATRCAQFEREPENLRATLVVLELNLSDKSVKLNKRISDSIKEINFALQLNSEIASQQYKSDYSTVKQIKYTKKDSCYPQFDVQSEHDLNCKKTVWNWDKMEYVCANSVCKSDASKKWVWSKAENQCCKGSRCCPLYKGLGKNNKCYCLDSLHVDVEEQKSKCISPPNTGGDGQCRREDSLQNDNYCCNEYGCCKGVHQYRNVNFECQCLPGYQWNDDSKQCEVKFKGCKKGDTQSGVDVDTAECTNDYGTCPAYRTAISSGDCICINGMHADANDDEGACVFPPNDGGKEGNCQPGDSWQEDEACCNSQGCCAQYEFSVTYKNDDCNCIPGYIRNDDGVCEKKPEVQYCLKTDTVKEDKDGNPLCCNSYGCCAAYGTQTKESKGHCLCIWGKHANAQNLASPCIKPPNSGNDGSCVSGSSLQVVQATKYCCNGVGCCYEHRTVSIGGTCRCMEGYYWNKDEGKCLETPEPPKVCLSTDSLDGPDDRGRFTCSNDNGSCPAYKSSDADGNCICIWGTHVDVLNPLGPCIQPPNTNQDGICQTGSSEQKSQSNKTKCCNGYGCCYKHQEKKSFDDECTCIDGFELNDAGDSCDRTPEDPVVCLDTDNQTKDDNGVFHCENDYGVCGAYKTHDDTGSKCSCIWGKHFEAASHNGPCIDPPNTDGQGGKCESDDVSVQKNSRNSTKCCNAYGCCGTHQYDDEDHQCHCDDGWVRHNWKHRCVRPGDEGKI